MTHKVCGWHTLCCRWCQTEASEASLRGQKWLLNHTTHWTGEWLEPERRYGLSSTLSNLCVLEEAMEAGPHNLSCMVWKPNHNQLQPYISRVTNVNNRRTFGRDTWIRTGRTHTSSMRVSEKRGFKNSQEFGGIKKRHSLLYIQSMDIIPYMNGLSIHSVLWLSVN